MGSDLSSDSVIHVLSNPGQRTLQYNSSSINRVLLLNIICWKVQTTSLILPTQQQSRELRPSSAPLRRRSPRSSLHLLLSISSPWECVAKVSLRLNWLRPVLLTTLQRGKPKPLQFSTLRHWKDLPWGCIRKLLLHWWGSLTGKSPDTKFFCKINF